MSRYGYNRANSDFMIGTEEREADQSERLRELAITRHLIGVQTQDAMWPDANNRVPLGRT